MELTRLKQLSHLDLRHSDSGDPTRGSVAAGAARSLASMTQLRSLCLRSVEALTPLVNLLTPLTGLTLLDLSECCRINGRWGLIHWDFSVLGSRYYWTSFQMVDGSHASS